MNGTHSSRRRTRPRVVRGFTVFKIALLLGIGWFIGLQYHLVNRQHPNDQSLSSYTSILYIGSFGLGHRLSKGAGAYDLAHVLGTNALDVHWGYCTLSMEEYQQLSLPRDVLGSVLHTEQSIKVELFTYLFDIPDGRILIKPLPLEHNLVPQLNGGNPNKTLLIQNDIVGYYAGQNYKNAQIPLTPKWLQEWNYKLSHDEEFFTILIQRFRYKELIQHFQQSHNWNVKMEKDSTSPLVIGLHLRFGNGEQQHFIESQRNIVGDTRSEQTQYVRNMLSLIEILLRQETRYRRAKKILLFLATDTPSMIPVVQDLSKQVGIETIVFPQERLEKGVSFQIKSGTSCLTGWKSSWIDMILLAQSDIVIAGMRSTFTQILPLTTVFRRTAGHVDKYRYCEVESNARTMTCFTDRDAWLLRRASNDTVTSTGYTERSVEDHPKPRILTLSLDGNDTSQVVHKVVVHLPDVDHPRIHASARDFLLRKDDNPDDTLKYGTRINTKYRDAKTYQRDWTW